MPPRTGESPLLPPVTQAAQTRLSGAGGRPAKKYKDYKKIRGSWAYRAWVGRGAARDERGRWRTCKAEFRLDMASSDAAHIEDLAAIMEVRHGTSRPLKRTWGDRSGQQRHVYRQRQRALRIDVVEHMAQHDWVLWPESAAPAPAAAGERPTDEIDANVESTAT